MYTGLKTMNNLITKKSEHRILEDIVKGAIGPFEKNCDGYWLWKSL